MAEVVVRPVEGRVELETFIRFPWRIYENDTMWVPPLRADVRAALDRDKHPFYKHGEVQTFLARRGDDVVGRIAAVLNHTYNEFHETKLGFFGLFESIDDQAVADAMLRTAEEWLRARGMHAVQGPMNFSTNEEICSPGVQIEGWHRPPALLMTHTPPYYAGLLERAGYVKAKDLIAYWLENEKTPERLQKTYDRLLRDGRVKLRNMDLSRFDEEVALVQEVYNASWERNWGFVPMSAAEIEYMAKQLKPIVTPHLTCVLTVDDVPAGFALGVPDYNVALKHVNGTLFPFGIFKLLWYRRKIVHARTITLGLKPEFRNRGLDALLLAHMFIEGRKVGIWRSECSWILEDNRGMRLGLERIGAVADKIYRVFEKSLV